MIEMKKIITIIKIFLLVWFTMPVLYAQDKPFYSEIEAFRKSDSIQMPDSNAILFTGSSSIRMWKDVQNDFPGKKIINRGFGGSSTPHVIQYANDIIFPYQPKQVVIYVGENDLTANPPPSPQEVANRVDSLFDLIHSKLPGVPIVYISIKPSIARQALMPQMVQTNKLIKEITDQKENIVFVDVYSRMLNKNGEPKDDIFIADNLHMNAKGYKIWKKALKHHLK